jgi:hypothetical protein
MRPILKLAAIVGLAIAVLPTVAAQNANAGSVFGNPIRIGDADYTPVAKGASFVPLFFVADFGGGTDIQKLCVVMASKAATSASNMPPLTGSFTTGGAADVFTSAEGRFMMRPDELRIAGCPGGPPGSRMGASQATESIVGFTALGLCTAEPCFSGGGSMTPFTTIQVVDANNDGKYGVGEALYLVYSGGVTAPTAPAGNGLQATSMGTFGLAAGNTLKFTIRLTSQLGYKAGTYVMAGDADFQQYATGAATGAAGTKIVAMGAVERDDKAVFLVPGGAGTIAQGGAISSGSVRMGPVGQAFVFPNIQATRITLASTDPVQAGQPFNVLVDLLNGGSGGGSGLLVTKMDDTIIDARMSVPVSAGQTDRMSWAVTIPCGGVHELKANDGFLVVSVEGLECNATSAASMTELADLQARLAALEASEAPALAKQGSPGFAPLAAFGTLAAIAMLLRRRAALSGTEVLLPPLLPFSPAVSPGSCDL